MPGLLVELDLHGFTHGGEAVGRLPSGKACFVPYAIPGERVRIEVVEERKRWARGRVAEILVASPDRVEPPCPYFGPDRCGGCKLQHIAPARQAELLRRVVTDQLERVGHLADPPVEATVRPHPGDGLGYRNRARFAVDRQGRLGFRRANSHDVQPIDRCLLLTDEAHKARDAAGDDWQGVEEVVVRGGSDGGSHLEVHPGAGGMPSLPDNDVPVAVVGAGHKAVPLRGDPVTSHTVGDRTFRVSPTSFYQASDAGAAELVRLVVEAADVGEDDEVLDLFAGAGLFTAVLAAHGARVTAVEVGRASVADAKANLTAFGDRVRVVRGDADAIVAGWSREGRTVDRVVLDPPRRGAGAQLCQGIVALRPRAVVYVSCDPAALARDARTLTNAGYTLTRAVPLDQFTHTAHVETVATFRPVILPTGTGQPG